MKDIESMEKFLIANSDCVEYQQVSHSILNAFDISSCFTFILHIFC